jgi:hypothetical protein
MRPGSRSRSTLASIALCATLVLAGCGDGLSGTYAAEGAVPMSFQFRSGGKVVATVAGESKEGTYTVNGNTVVVTMEGSPATFTRQKDGTLAAQGEMMGLTLKKK